jgi:hypothetical protein
MLFNLLGDIEGVAAFSPASVGNSEQWSAIVNSPEENRQNPCKALSGKTLFSALYGIYAATFLGLKAVLQAAATQEEGFKEVRRRKMHNTDETSPASKKVVATAASDAVHPPPPGKRSSPVISSPPSGQPQWTRILPVRRLHHKKRQFRENKERQPQ